MQKLWSRSYFQILKAGTALIEVNTVNGSTTTSKVFNCNNDPVYMQLGYAICKVTDTQTKTYYAILRQKGWNEVLKEFHKVK